MQVMTNHCDEIDRKEIASLKPHMESSFIEQEIHEIQRAEGSRFLLGDRDNNNFFKQWLLLGNGKIPWGELKTSKEIGLATYMESPRLSLQNLKRD